MNTACVTSTKDSFAKSGPDRSQHTRPIRVLGKADCPPQSCRRSNVSRRITLQWLMAYRQQSHWLSLWQYRAAEQGGEDDVLCQKLRQVLQQDDQLANWHLFDTINHNDVPWLKRLIDSGIDINSSDFLGNTPLHLAAAKGFTDCVRLLLLNRANFTIVNEQQQTARDIAVEYQQGACYQLLSGISI